MNYAHDFHAGNFADVLKHVVLVRALLLLARKDAPLRFIDTHAGAGVYDLAGERAEKTQEWRAGVGKLLDGALTRDAMEPVARALVKPYLEIVAGPLGEARYPGSPRIAAALLRPQDRLVACELHPDAFARLKAALAGDSRARPVELDGYLGLKAFTPPPERRGLVLIDPPFEDREEFARLSRALPAAVRKWPTGVFMLWLPVKDPRAAQDFARGLGEATAPHAGRGALRLDLEVAPPAPDAPLARTALILVNPPFGLFEEAQAILPELARVLGRGRGAHLVEWIVQPR
ncbi:23S rRNA (adenine(2030)-N(6))-methyltransferase RlmJ [Methylocella sp.]|uniref:23S rRNA (adenine(2030)-N(6))-methyltransferase RlmJ n=1 Tax=Methylocella sp. TaxID=1978226 RepID=UPI0035B1C304